MSNKSIWNQAFHPKKYKDGYGREREEYVSPIAFALRKIDKFLNGQCPIAITDDSGNPVLDENREQITVLPNEGLGALEFFTPEFPAAVAKGAGNAVKFLTSPAQNERQVFLTKLAHRLGFKNYKPSRAPVTDIPIREVALPDKTKGRLVKVAGQPELTEIQIASDTDIPLTTYHEVLHQANYGKPMEYGEEAKEVVEDQWRLYDLLNKKLLDPKAPHTKTWDYLSSTEDGELATILAQIGEKYKLTGKVYPGEKEAAQIIEALKQDSQLGEYLRYVNSNKPKRVWDALTGSYYKDGGKIKRLLWK